MPNPTPRPSSPKAERGALRVLIAADAGFAQFVEQCIGPAHPTAALATAGSFLWAMGQARMTQPHVFLTPLSWLNGTPGRTDASHAVPDMELDGEAMRTAVASLRRVSPASRIVVVARQDQEEQAVAALSLGVDDYLLEPIQAEALSRVLQPWPSPPLPPTAAPAPVATDAANTGSASIDVTELPELHVPGASPPLDDAELGDVDLVERLLEGRRGLHKMAVRLIAARSGLEGIDWSPRIELVPAGCASCAVRLGQETFGFLHAPTPVDETELASWAAWLARWLALEGRLALLQDLSLRDELTGVWNRRYFNSFLARTLDEATAHRHQVTLLVFDIDDFKQYNDRYGHSAGDDILREAARLMQSVVRDHDVVARIGGDEFAVIFWDAQGPRKPNSQHPDDVLQAARRFQQAICSHKFPKLLHDAHGTLTISGGLATFPWDGRTPQELIDKADAMALRSKQQGKNAITFGPGATRVCGTGGTSGP